MNFARAMQGIQNVTSFLNRGGLVQTINVQIDSVHKVIGWPAYEPGVLRGVGYPMEYQYLIDRHQYSYLLEDGSFIQIFFRFDERDSLISGRQAFYPRPVPIRGREESVWDAAENAIDRGDEDIMNYLLNWIELMEFDPKFIPANTSHIRFDYDSEVTVHCKSHLQLGAIQDLRIPANFFPQPMAFIQLCQSLIPRGVSIDSSELGYERNNILSLDPPDGLISLGCA